MTPIIAQLLTHVNLSWGYRGVKRAIKTAQLKTAACTCKRDKLVAMIEW